PSACSGAASRPSSPDLSETGALMMPAVIPYITVSNADEAMDFYKKAFGATENARVAEPEGKKRIMHGDLTIKGGSVFVMDVFAEHAGTEGCGSVAAPSPAKPSAT